MYCVIVYQEHNTDPKNINNTNVQYNKDLDDGDDDGQQYNIFVIILILFVRFIRDTSSESLIEYRLSWSSWFLMIFVWSFLIILQYDDAVIDVVDEDDIVTIIFVGIFWIVLFVAR